VQGIVLCGDCWRGAATLTGPDSMESSAKAGPRMKDTRPRGHCIWQRQSVRSGALQSLEANTGTVPESAGDPMGVSAGDGDIWRRLLHPCSLVDAL
jgi:hypothetical protein